MPRRDPRLERPTLLTAQFGRVLIYVLILCAVLLIGPAEAEKRTRRILILYPYNNLYPVGVSAGEAVRKRLIAGSPEPLEAYS